MLGFFPAPMRGESFYSCASRYAELVGRNDVPGFLNRTKASIGMPRGISGLLDQLPPGSPLTTSQMIWEHTAYPYFAAFLARKQRRYVRQAMSAGTHLKSCKGLTTEVRRWISEANRLRLCLECIEDDREEFGFATWKTLHQLPGVFVCPAHRQALRVVSFAGRNLELITVTDDIVSGARVESVPDWVLADDVAQMSQWLLGHQITSPPARVRSHLIALLTYRGYSHGGTWSPNLVREALLRQYGNDVLSLFECGFDSGFMTKNNWLTALAADQPLHPVKHLLLLSFLEASVSECFLFEKSTGQSHQDRYLGSAFDQGSLEVMRVPYPESVDKAPRILKNNDILALLTVCDKTRYPVRNRAIVLLATDAGLLPSEIAQMNRRSVLNQDNQIAEEIDLTFRTNKWLRPRRIPMPKNGRLWLTIRDLLANGDALPNDPLIVSERGCEDSDARSWQNTPALTPMRATSIRYIFWKLCERADLRVEGTRAARRTFIVMAGRRAKDVGATLRDVQLLAGHRSLEMTQRLIDAEPADPEAQRRLMNDLFRVGVVREPGTSGGR